ncbi:MAG: family 1 glycosylhydrolase, partial [Anaeromyxobacter sp.]|nr:family 1 glycosylhydrolase [Anaeromyxobacter sp.]
MSAPARPPTRPPTRPPPGFLLGAATAAHAVEGGGPPSDWSIWEQVPGRVAGGATSRRGAGWWERADDDFVMAARLSLTALRFSVEWSRVEPDEGRFDEGAGALRRLGRAAARARAGAGGLPAPRHAAGLAGRPGRPGAARRGGPLHPLRRPGGGRALRPGPLVADDERPGGPG